MLVTWLLQNGIHKENVSKMKIMQIVFICIHCDSTSIAKNEEMPTKQTWANIFGTDLESGSLKRKKNPKKCRPNLRMRKMKSETRCEC